MNNWKCLGFPSSLQDHEANQERPGVHAGHGNLLQTASLTLFTKVYVLWVKWGKRWEQAQT